jgi:hypothetical protein
MKFDKTAEYGRVEMGLRIKQVLCLSACNYEYQSFIPWEIA